MVESLVDTAIDAERSTASSLPVVFLTGAPRSGTSWLGNLLNSDPQVIYRHEMLGRVAKRLSAEVFFQLRFGNGLCDASWSQLLDFLLETHPESDRPPFFHKAHDRCPLALRQGLWLLASRLGYAAPLYRRLNRPRVTSESILLLKELGWTVLLPSLLEGLRPSLVLFLIRHPCAVVASHLEGIERQLMRLPDKAYRRQWYEWHGKEDTVRGFALTETDVLGLEVAEFLALNWRNMTDVMLSYQRGRGACRMIFYEQLQADPRAALEPVFEALGRPLTEQTEAFIRQSRGEGPAPSWKLFRRDAGHEFFSVYRDSRFDRAAWKNTLSPSQIAGIERFTGDLELIEQCQS